MDGGGNRADAARDRRRVDPERCSRLDGAVAGGRGRRRRRLDHSHVRSRMSDFFGPPPPPPPEPPDHRSPEWSGPPENELAVVAPVQIELIRSDRLSLAIRALIVYSTGSMLMLALRRRKRPPLRAFGSPPFHASQPDSLRFGVRFADGSKATAGRPMRPGDTISPPALILRGTRNGGRSSETEMWMWPLPPPGLLEFVCEW